MRIEYQGMVEAQPTYQHVGYISSTAYRRVVDHDALQAGTGLFTLGVVLAMIAKRRARTNSHGRTAALALLAALVLAVGIAIGGASVRGREKYYEHPQSITSDRLYFHVSGMDRLIAAWGGYCPPEVSWGWSPQRQRVSIDDSGCDAWGTRLRFSRLSRADPKGRRFIVSSAGPDGEFGTADDVSAHGGELTELKPYPARALLPKGAWDVSFEHSVTDAGIAAALVEVDRTIAQAKGRVPATLPWAFCPEQPERRLTTPTTLDARDAWGYPLAYRPLPRPGADGRRYDLFSTGPDRKPDTADDVRLPPGWAPRLLGNPAPLPRVR